MYNRFSSELFFLHKLFQYRCFFILPALRADVAQSVEQLIRNQ